MLIKIETMAPCLLLGLASAALVACATAYKPEGITGGYSDKEVQRGVYLVTFSGNGYTSRQSVAAMAQRRALELCTRDGYGDFRIVNSNEDISKYSLPATSSCTSWYDGNVSCTHSPGAVVSKASQNLLVQCTKPGLELSIDLCNDGDQLGCIAAGDALVEQGRLEEARKLLEPACASTKRAGCLAQSSLALKYMEKNDFGTTAVLSDQPCQYGDWGACDRQAISLYKLGRFDSAVNLWKLACEMDQPFSCYYLGQMATEQQSRAIFHDKAKRLFSAECKKGMQPACSMLRSIIDQEQTSPKSSLIEVSPNNF